MNMRLAAILPAVLLVSVLTSPADAAIDLTFNNSFQRNPTGSANLVNDVTALPDWPVASDFMGDQTTVKLGSKIYAANSTGTRPGPGALADDALVTGLGLSGPMLPSLDGDGLVWHYGQEDFSGANKVALWDYNSTTDRTRLTGLKSAATFALSSIGNPYDWTPIPGSLVGKTGQWGIILFSSITVTQGDINTTATLTARAVPIDFRGYVSDAAITADIVTDFSGTSISGLMSYLLDPNNNAKGIEYEPNTGNFWVTHNGTTVEWRNNSGSLVDSLDVTTIAGIANPPDAANTASFDMDYISQAGNTVMMVRRTTGQDFGSGRLNESVVYNFTFTPAVIPEPATLALLALGGLAIALPAVRRRRV